MPDLTNIHEKFFPKAKTVGTGKFLIKFAWAIEILVALTALSLSYIMLLSGSQANTELSDLGQNLSQNGTDTIILGIAFIVVAVMELTKIPLATVTVLFFTAPLFVTILAGPCLNEDVGWRRSLAATFGFIGSFIALNPATSEFQWVLLAPFAASALFATSLIIGKQLSKTESANSILLYTSAITMIGSLGPAIWVWQSMNTSIFLLCFAIAIFALLRTYADIRAYAVGEASFISPFSYLRLVFVSIAGYIFFSEVPENTVYWGGFVIVVSSIYIAHRETTHKKKISPPSTEPGGD